MSRNYQSFVRYTAFVFLSTFTLFAWSDTWSDSSGNFSIDAKFVGVEGQSIILLKNDGKKISVPIAKLSEQSRERAKQLYRARMSEFDEQESPASGNSESSRTARPKRVLNFQPPVPPPATASKAFPDGLSVEQTLAFIKKQILDGHPEVFWDAVPKEMQKSFDDPKFREEMDPIMKSQSQISDAIEPILFKVIEVFVTKKKFVLGSSLMASIPPDELPNIRQGYDPAVGVAYEISDFAFSMDFKARSVSEMMNDHGPRIGAHLKRLLAIAPRGTIDGIFESISIEQLDPDHAIISMPSQGSPSGPGFGSVKMEDTKLVRVSNRWVPEDLVNQWEILKAQLESGEFGNGLEEFKEASEKQSQQGMMFVGMMAGGIGTMLDGLLAAKTQEEFDAQIVQASAMLPFGGGNDFRMNGPGMDE